MVIICDACDVFDADPPILTEYEDESVKLCKIAHKVMTAMIIIKGPKFTSNLPTGIKSNFFINGTIHIDAALFCRLQARQKLKLCRSFYNEPDAIINFTKNRRINKQAILYTDHIKHNNCIFKSSGMWQNISNKQCYYCMIKFTDDNCFMNNAALLCPKCSNQSPGEITMCIYHGKVFDRVYPNFDPNDKCGILNVDGFFGWQRVHLFHLIL